MSTPTKILARLAAGAAAIVAATAVAVPSAWAQPSPTPIPQTFGIAPAGPQGPDGRAAFDFKLDPGAQLADTVAVVNPSQTPLTLLVYAHDAFTTASGGFDIGTRATTPVGAGAWVSFPAGNSITVPARSRVNVPFSLAVPGNATPGDHAAGIVAELAETSEAGVNVARRTGVRLHLRISGTLAPSLSVENLSADWRGTWNPFSGGTVKATFTIHNTGNTRLTAAPSVKIKGPLGIAAGGGRGEPVTQILPGQSVTVTVTASGVLPWGYLSVAAHAGGGSVPGASAGPAVPDIEAGTRVWAVPWPQLALIVLLAAAAFAVWRWYRVRRRRGENPASSKVSGRHHVKETAS